MALNFNRRRFVQALSLSGASGLSPMLTLASDEWSAVVKAAKGQTVFFNAWAGSDTINAYIQWAGDQLKAEYGVKLEHVKITDAADVVKRVRTEKAAGRGARGGTVDLMWINGENFANMKKEALLFGPFTQRLPNWALVDTKGKPTTLQDFSVPTDGLESPWGMAQLTFFADSHRLQALPQNSADLLNLARQHPGRLTYPRPPAFHGTTFIKQVLLETAPDRKALYQAATPAALDKQTRKLWDYLAELHPLLWRKGEQFPESASDIRNLVSAGELLLGLTFNPNDAANEIAAGRMAPSTVSWQFKGGSIGNTHFVAIPYNAPSPEAAQVVANFLLSPVAQARKADITLWGDPTVLDVAKVPAAQRALFEGARLPGQVKEAAPTLPEPHASWVEPLEKEWIRRFGS